MLIVANIDADRFRTSTSGPALVFSQARNAADLGNGGLALIGGGAAVAVAGAVLYFARPAPVQPVVMLTPEGGFVGVSGVFR